MANQALKFLSTPQFWTADRGGLTIGMVLDAFTKKQGVACDGVINGLVLGTTEVKLSLETIADIDYLVVRNCAGTIVMSIASGIDSQAITKQYLAILTGSNGAIAAPAVQQNTLGGTIVWAYVSEGVYTGTLVGAFTALKTSIQISNATATGGVVLTAVRTSANVVTISTFAADGTTPADFIGDINIAITVQP